MTGISRNLALAFALAGTLAATAPARAEDASHFTAQSAFSETGSGEDLVETITNTSFATDLIYAPDLSDSANVLYEQHVTSKVSAGVEATSSDLTVTARRKGVAGYDTVLWTIHDDGNEGQDLGEYYRTTEWGCCGAENTHRSYFAWTGRLAFTSTADPLFLAIPNTPTRRAIAYLSAYSVDGIEGEKYPRGAGLVTIVDGDRTVDRVLLESDEGTGFEWTPMLELSDPTGAHEQNGDTFDVWSADGKPDPAGLSGIDLVLSWDPEMGGVAKIPFVAGRLDLDHAQLPDGLTLRRLAN